MAVLPSDHFIQKGEAYARLLQQGEKAARAYGLVTFGIAPHYPETGYGYILRGGGSMKTHSWWSASWRSRTGRRPQPTWKMGATPGTAACSCSR